MVSKRGGAQTRTNREPPMGLSTRRPQRPFHLHCGFPIKVNISVVLYRGQQFATVKHMVFALFRFLIFIFPLEHFGFHFPFEAILVFIFFWIPSFLNRRGQAVTRTGWQVPVQHFWLGFSKLFFVGFWENLKKITLYFLRNRSIWLDMSSHWDKTEPHGSGSFSNPLLTPKQFIWTSKWQQIQWMAPWNSIECLFTKILDTRLQTLLICLAIAPKWP